MSRLFRAARLAAVMLALSLAAPALAQPSQEEDPGAGVELAWTERVRAMVLTVDREAGQILMRNLDTGEVFVHEPPKEMSGLLNVESGDVLEAVVTRGVTARPAEAGDLERTETRMVTAPSGSDRGAGFVGGTLERTVMTLEAWNPVTNVAVARTAEGRMQRFHVTTEEGRAFAETLEPGDRIDVEFSNTVVVTRPDR